MDDQIAGVEDSADVESLMAGIDELLARSLAIMTQRQPMTAAEPAPRLAGRQPVELVEA